jgi:hypothetical protein
VLVEFVLRSSNDRNLGTTAAAERNWRILVPVVARGRGSGAELVPRHGSRLAGAEGGAVRSGEISITALQPDQDRLSLAQPAQDLGLAPGDDPHLDVGPSAAAVLQVLDVAARPRQADRPLGNERHVLL